MPKRFRKPSGNGADKRVVRRTLHPQAIALSNKISGLRRHREEIMKNKKLTPKERARLLAENGGEIQKLKQELARLEGELGKP